MRIPPNTPVGRVGIPKTLTYIGLVPTSLISTPAIIPVVIFITKNPTIAARAATPSPEDIPIATPTANNNGKLSNTILPADDIILAIS